MADPNLEVRGGNGFLPLALPAFLPSAIPFFFFFFKQKRRGKGGVDGAVQLAIRVR